MPPSQKVTPEPKIPRNAPLEEGVQRSLTQAFDATELVEDNPVATSHAGLGCKLFDNLPLNVEKTMCVCVC